MGHQLESMVSGMNVTPWHKLGKIVDGALTAEEALTLGGLDWKVKKTPIWTPGYNDDPAQEGFSIDNLNQSTRDYAIVRSTDNKVLGTVGSVYTPLQNESAFRFFDGLVSRGEAIYHTAGSLDEGRVVWLLAQLPNDVVLRTPSGERDITKQYVLLYNSFDGRSSVIAKLTSVRCCCANTLAMALQGKEPKFSIAHNKQVEDQIATMAKDMGLMNRFTESFTEAAQAMINTQVKNQAQATDFLRKCFDSAYNPVQGQDDSSLEDGPTPKLAKAISKSLELFETGMGMELSPYSVWNLYQASVEFVDHAANYRSDDGRLKNAWFDGPNYKSKLRAYEEAVRLVTA